MSIETNNNEHRSVDLNLEVLYEDNEVIVMKAPKDRELEELILKIIKEKGRPVSWKELREVFSGLAGEDRLRKALGNLIDKGKLVELPDGNFALPGMEHMVDWERARRRRGRLRFAYKKYFKKGVPIIVEAPM